MAEQQKQLDGAGQQQAGGAIPPREYRVLIGVNHDLNKEGPSPVSDWKDYGLHAAANPQAAIKHARKDPDARRALADGMHVVAVPASYFEELTLTVETIERESFKPVK